jgi:protein-L-isoaspartate(D-aspartate) O-methyltransferase
MMTQLLLEKQPMNKVLEIGTGCGYQTAVLGKLVKEIYTLERIAPLMDKARRHLRDLRFYNVRFKHADGHAGYQEGAPYDGILMAASATHVPDALKQQLAIGGRMVLPVGIEDQWLWTVDRTDKGFVEQKRAAVRFVPLLPGLS